MAATRSAFRRSLGRLRAPGASARCRADELAEERRRPRRPRLELRVELAGDEPRVIGQLDDLDEPALLERARDDEAGVDELLAVVVVDLVAVPVALVDDRLAVASRASASPRRARPPARRGASCRRGPRSPSAPAAGRSPGTASRDPSRSSWRRRGRRRGARTRRRRRACRGRCRGTGSAARGRRGTRGSCPPSRASRSRRGRARRRRCSSSRSASS